MLSRRIIVKKKQVLSIMNKMKLEKIIGFVVPILIAGGITIYERYLKYKERENSLYLDRIREKGL